MVMGEALPGPGHVHGPECVLPAEVKAFADATGVRIPVIPNVKGRLIDVRPGDHRAELIAGDGLRITMHADKINELQEIMFDIFQVETPSRADISQARKLIAGIGQANPDAAVRASIVNPKLLDLVTDHLGARIISPEGSFTSSLQGGIGRGFRVEFPREAIAKGLPFQPLPTTRVRAQHRISRIDDVVESATTQAGEPLSPDEQGLRVTFPERFISDDLRQAPERAVLALDEGVRLPPQPENMQAAIKAERDVMARKEHVFWGADERLVNDTATRMRFREGLVRDDMAKRTQVAIDGKSYPIVQERTATIVTGPMGGGKSSVVMNDEIMRGSRLIDADEFKGPIAANERYTNGIKEGGDGMASPAHTQSTLVSRGVMTEAIDRGDRMVIGTTGMDMRRTSAVGEALDALGYDVHLVSVIVNPNEAAQRVISRYGGGEGRLTNPDKVASMGFGPERNHATLKKEAWVHGHEQYDNGGPPGSGATLIDSGGANLERTGDVAGGAGVDPRSGRPDGAARGLPPVRSDAAPVEPQLQGRAIPEPPAAPAEPTGAAAADRAPADPTRATPAQRTLAGDTERPLTTEGPLEQQGELLDTSGLERSDVPAEQRPLPGVEEPPRQVNMLDEAGEPRRVGCKA